MSLLCFLLCFMTMTKGELIAENAIQIQTYQVTANEELAAEEEEPQSSTRYYGNCRITFSALGRAAADNGPLESQPPVLLQLRDELSPMDLYHLVRKFSLMGSSTLSKTGE